MLNAVFMTDPALSHKLNKLTVYVFWRATALFPVENEFRSYTVVKRGGYLRSCKDFLGIATGLPLIIKFGWLFNVERGVLLTVAPLG